MENNPKFNTYFVSVVKKHEVLYNHNVDGYANKECIKAAWRKVAEEVKASEQECKDRWRCLRVSFLRTLRHTTPLNLRGQDNSHRKTYYLTEALSFLLPFVKPKHAPLGFEVRRPVKIEPDYEIEEDSASTEDQPELYAPDLLEETDHSNPSSIASARVPEYCTETPEHERQGFNVSQKLYFAPSDRLMQLAEHGSNRKKLKTERFYEINPEPGCSKYDEDADGDMLFLKSILPDMRRLTEKQKRRFKQKVLGLFDEIVEEDAAYNSLLSSESKEK